MFGYLEKKMDAFGDWVGDPAKKWAVITRAKGLDLDSDSDFEREFEEESRAFTLGEVYWNDLNKRLGRFFVLSDMVMPGFGENPIDINKNLPPLGDTIEKSTQKARKVTLFLGLLAQKVLDPLVREFRECRVVSAYQNAKMQQKHDFPFPRYLAEAHQKGLAALVFVPGDVNAVACDFLVELKIPYIQTLILHHVDTDMYGRWIEVEIALSKVKKPTMLFTMEDDKGKVVLQDVTKEGFAIPAARIYAKANPSVNSLDVAKAHLKDVVAMSARHLKKVQDTLQKRIRAREAAVKEIFAKVKMPDTPDSTDDLQGAKGGFIATETFDGVRKLAKYIDTVGQAIDMLEKAVAKADKGITKKDKSMARVDKAVGYLGREGRVLTDEELELLDEVKKEAKVAMKLMAMRSLQRQEVHTAQLLAKFIGTLWKKRLQRGVTQALHKILRKAVAGLITGATARGLAKHTLKHAFKHAIRHATKHAFKHAFKHGSKRIPGVGVVIGLGLGVGRLWEDGDWLGAGLEALTGMAGIPLVGEGIAIPAEIALAANDVWKAWEKARKEREKAVKDYLNAVRTLTTLRVGEQWSGFDNEQKYVLARVELEARDIAWFQDGEDLVDEVNLVLGAVNATQQRLKGVWVMEQAQKSMPNGKKRDAKQKRPAMLSGAGYNSSGDEWTTGGWLEKSDGSSSEGRRRRRQRPRRRRRRRRDQRGRLAELKAEHRELMRENRELHESLDRARDLMMKARALC